MVKSGTIRLVSAIVCNALVLYVQQKPSIKPHIYHIYESLIVFLKSVPFWSPCTGVASFWKPIVSIVLEGLVQESFFQGHLSSKNSYSPELTGLVYILETCISSNLNLSGNPTFICRSPTCLETLLLYVEVLPVEIQIFQSPSVSEALNLSEALYFLTPQFSGNINFSETLTFPSKPYFLKPEFQETLPSTKLF